jgi:hypothetical protein
VIFRQSNGAVEAEIDALVTNLSEKSGVIKAECVVKREKRTLDDVSAACQASTLPKFWASLP